MGFTLSQLKEQEKLLQEEIELERQIEIESGGSRGQVGIFGKVDKKDYLEGERNVLGNIFERPSAPNKEVIRKHPLLGMIPLTSVFAGNLAQTGLLGRETKDLATEKSINPTGVELFADQYPRIVNQFMSKATAKIENPLLKKYAIGQTGGAMTLATLAGMVKDIETSPADILTIMAAESASAKQLLSKAMQGFSETGFGRFMGSSPKQIVSRQISKLKNLGRASRASYITDDIAPLAHDVYKARVEQFGDDIQRLGKNKGMSESSIKTIKDKGVHDVRNTNLSFGDSTDPIYMRMEKAFEQKAQGVHKIYQKAIDKGPKNKMYDLTPLRDKVKEQLRQLNFVDKNGKLTEEGVKLSRMDSTHSKMVRLYDYMNSVEKEYTVTLATKHGKSKLPVNKIKTNKAQFKYIRDRINELYRADTSDIAVKKMADSLYDLGEKQGMTGLNQARKLERELFGMKKQWINKSTGKVKGVTEKTLDRFHKMTANQVRELKDLEKYIGVNFVDDTSKITAARELKKLDRVNLDIMTSELNNAVNPKFTNKVMKDYRPLLGDATDDIFKEIRNYRRIGRIKKGLGIGGGLLAGKEFILDPLVGFLKK